MSKQYGAASLVKQDLMTRRQNWMLRLLIGVGVFMTALFGAWWFEPGHVPTNFHGLEHVLDFILFGVLSYVIWHQIVSELFTWGVAKDMKHPTYMTPTKGKKVAFVTAFVPGKEPYDILENTLNHMVAVDYPHDTWVLDEGDDKRVKEICKQLGVHHYTRKGIPHYNMESGRFKAKTKAGNHNSWHEQHGGKYDFIAQIDVDFVPRKDFLTRTLGYFRDPEVAFVGSPQIYGNLDESWIAQGAAEQAYSFYGAIQKGFFGKDMQLFIGANHVVRVAAIKDIEGYSGHIVEDHLTGMRIYANRWKSVYIPEKLAIGEGPATWDAYFSQQMRWAYGLIDILFHHSPKILPKMKRKHAINYYFLQQHYFYGLVQVLGVVLLTLFFSFGIQSTTMALIPLLALYVPLILWQTVISLWLQKFNVDPEMESDALLKGKLLTLAAWPIYFIAFIGVITGKRLTYAVTPKGAQQDSSVPLTLFLPHFVLGTITGIDVILSFVDARSAPLLLFWAIVNTITMYGFILAIAGQRLASGFASRFAHRFTLPRFLRLQLSEES